MNKAESNSVLTIGHSNQSMDSFLAILLDYGVDAVADVRSVPYSRHAPHFSRDPLESALRGAGIKYVFLGDALGARSDDPSCYLNGQVQYARLANKASFKAALERIVHGSHAHRIAIMCAEKEPLQCHRSLLISTALEEAGVSVEHILATGLIENHHTTLTRLVHDYFPSPATLFQSGEEVLRAAIAMQERKIAYVDHSLAKSPKGAIG